MSKPRKISVDGKQYFWVTKHFHFPGVDKPFICSNKITVYLDSFKRSPLILIFSQDSGNDDWYVSDSDRIVAKRVGDNVEVVNLSRPSVIAELIRYFLKNGWNPEENIRPYEVNDASKFLDLIDLPRGMASKWAEN